MGSGTEIDRRGAVGAVRVGLLPPVRGLHDAVAYPAEEQLELDPGSLELLQQGAGVGAVLAPAVFRHRVGARGRRDDRVRWGIVHAGEPGLGGDRLGTAALDEPVVERTVPRGVEDHDAELSGLADLAQEQVERHRLVDQVAAALEPCVGRDQIVLAVDLEAVAGEVDERQVLVRHLLAELAQACRRAGDNRSRAQGRRRSRARPEPRPWPERHGPGSPAWGRWRRHRFRQRGRRAPPPAPGASRGRDEPGQQEQKERTTETAHAFLLLRAHLGLRLLF